MADYHEHLDQVIAGLADALGHLADIRQAMAELDAAGRAVQGVAEDRPCTIGAGVRRRRTGRLPQHKRREVTQ